MTGRSSKSKVTFPRIRATTTPTPDLRIHLLVSLARAPRLRSRRACALATRRLLGGVLQMARRRRAVRRTACRSSTARPYSSAVGQRAGAASAAPARPRCGRCARTHELGRDIDVLDGPRTCTARSASSASRRSTCSFWSVAAESAPTTASCSRACARRHPPRARARSRHRAAAPRGEPRIERRRVAQLLGALPGASTCAPRGRGLVGARLLARVRRRPCAHARVQLRARRPRRQARSARVLVEMREPLVARGCALEHGLAQRGERGVT